MPLGLQYTYTLKKTILTRNQTHTNIRTSNHLYMYTCIQANTHTYTHPYTQTHMVTLECRFVSKTHAYTQTHILSHTYTYTNIHTSNHPCIHTSIHTYLHSSSSYSPIRKHIQTYKYPTILTCTQSYIHTSIHTYLHSHTNLHSSATWSPRLAGSSVSLLLATRNSSILPKVPISKQTQ